MRLTRPVYEALPLLYAAIGVLAFLIAYLDSASSRAILAFVIGLIVQIAALTVFLRRQDYRAQSREYRGTPIDFPSASSG